VTEQAVEKHSALDIDMKVELPNSFKHDSAPPYSQNHGLSNKYTVVNTAGEAEAVLPKSINHTINKETPSDT